MGPTVVASIPEPGMISIIVCESREGKGRASGFVCSRLGIIEFLIATDVEMNRDIRVSRPAGADGLPPLQRKHDANKTVAG